MPLPTKRRDPWDEQSLAATWESGDGIRDGSAGGGLDEPEQGGALLEDNRDSENATPDETWDSVDTPDDDGGTEPTCSYLADMVGSELDKIPEEYRRVLTAEDGEPHDISVLQHGGFVVLRMRTSRRWMFHKTAVRVK